MAKVIPLSRTFPKGHPRQGEPTYFVEKVWRSLPMRISYKLICDINPEKESLAWPFWKTINHSGIISKHHTIRSGKRFKTGDIVSLRVWGDNINPQSGRKGPYHSNQIAIAPDVEVRVWDFVIYEDYEVHVNGVFYCNLFSERFTAIAENDGLNDHDMRMWLLPKKAVTFSGQIICWNPAITY